MTQPPTGSGALPLQEYRRDIPPGWAPGDPQYPLRLYFDRLRLWYRMCNLDDDIIGPVIAGRLYGKAGKIALSLRVPRPDGTHDVGDAALSRLSVDEVRDPATGAIIQEHIPSGVQFLTDALKSAFGQMDQDLATQSLERFFNLHRGKMSLAEYSVEFETRLEEASDRAGLQLNNVGRFYLFFRGSGLGAKTIDDIKMQIGGDYQRFQDARQLALRLTPNRQEEHSDILYSHDDHWSWAQDNEIYYDQEDYWDQDDNGYWVYHEGGQWYEDTGEYYEDEPQWWECQEDDGGWHYEQEETTSPQAAADPETTQEEETQGDYYGKSGFKGKGKDQDGCFNCGSKWHRVRDCPLSKDHGKSKGSYMKGKGYGGGKSRPKGWSWRPYGKSGYKGKKGFRSFGKGYKGKKGYSKGGKGYGSWFSSDGTAKEASTFTTAIVKTRKGLDISDGIPDSSTTIRSRQTSQTKEFVIHTSSEEQEEIVRLKKTDAENQEPEHKAEEGDGTTSQTMPQKNHRAAFSFVSSFYDINEYFVVRGQKRRGLLIDPGAASGLIGSETLRDLLETCVQPFGTKEQVEIRYDKTSPVSGISGSSDRTLGQITVPLQANGHPISYTGEVLGGQGSLCPALVGNPALRRMNAALLTNFFENGDGLLTTDFLDENSDGDKVTKVKLFRLLLTESGHYLLPTDEANTKTKLPDGTRKDVVTFFTKVTEESARLWSDVSERMKHCFFAESAKPTQTEGDRGELQPEHQDPAEEGVREPMTQSVHEETTTPLTLEHRTTLDDHEDHKVDAMNQAATEPATADVSQRADNLSRTPKFSNHTHHDEDKPCDDCPTTTAQVLHFEDDFPPYAGDQIPDTMDHKKMERRYRAIPEEYYNKTGFRPVTPGNFKKWFSKARGRGLRWHFWEICSGSGRLSLTLLLAGLIIGFPVDARYGWDLNNHGHQQMLNMARDEFKPGFIHHSPDCAPWSVSSNQKDPHERHLERLRDLPALQWTQQSCERQDHEDRGYSVEQPWGSAMWREDNESPLRLDCIPGNRTKQRVDQCMHDAKDERGQLIQKATGLGANIKFAKTALRCSGHNGKPHSQLQGQAPNGLARTSMAAVYPRTMCQRMKLDIINFLNKKNMIQLKRWPQELSWFVAGHYYECTRCQLGRACPPDIPHTMVPGECRHGKKVKMNPKEVIEDPVKRWKHFTNQESFEQILLHNNSKIDLVVDTSHWLKKMLMETVHNALGLFNEASARKIDFDHWVDNAVLMSLYKEVFQNHMQVKAVKVSLRPFNKIGPDPQMVKSSAYLRLEITGHVKEWTIHEMEDLREMSHSQINTECEVENWMVTLYGQDVDAVPAPSTPSKRPRSIPAQPALPPRADDAALVPRVMERPENPAEQPLALEDAPYEEFDAHDRRDLAPIKPNYNLRRVLEKLPKIIADGDNTKAKRLLLGLHERLWHTPIGDFVNLLRRAGMPTEVTDLAKDAVLSCPVCRKYIRLPNRPQMRSRGAHVFNEALQIDLFHWENQWFMLMIDEATRFKACSAIPGQESEQLLECLLKSWIYMFGPPSKVIMDQQMSLMGHETAAEFERLGMTRCPRGTTAGQGADQHTGTGIAERHVQLLKLTMMKLRAELQRQGLQHELQDLCQESAMAHNITLNYGGATPTMSVFGMLPRGFYDPESDGVLATMGALQTDVTPFEKAIRIRQTALAQTQQAIIEDRVARASRTRPHQLKLGELTAGTSEVEFCREVKGDPGWRGPALLLRLDETEGTAVIQYQGKPYLVSLRHVRPYQGIFHVDMQTEDTETALFNLMRYVESLTDYKVYLYGWLQKKDGSWYKTPKDDFAVQKVYQWISTIAKSMKRDDYHGIMMGKCLRSFKPPNNTTGTMLTWIRSGKNYSIMEYQNSNHLQIKKFSCYPREELCMAYLYRYNKPEAETEPSPPRVDKETKMDVSETKEDDKMSITETKERKRDGPETRTVVLAPERKRQRLHHMKKDIEFLRMHYVEGCKNKFILNDYPESWKNGYDMMTAATRSFLARHNEQERAALPILFNVEYKSDHHAMADLRTAQIFKVDDETQNIDEDDISPELWDQVEAADRAEIAQFVDEKAFKKFPRSQITAEMVVIDARWVRKWKKYPDRTRKVKSRLCARGFLDQQKSLLTTRSTTATRLSQRILVSHAAGSRKRTLESIDVAGAFLKGFSFEQIQKTLRKMGIDAPTRVVIIIPPANVFRHLAALSDDFKIAEWQIHEFGLLCIKPVYGLNDAPLAWQLCWHQYLQHTGGERSHLDENSFVWKKDGECIAMATTHVDDIAISAPLTWIDELNKGFIAKFGKVTRQQLPFTHCGCEYQKVVDGYKISQQEFSEKVKPAPVPKRDDSSRLTKEELSDFRSILGALLWLTATRLDIVADISLLQSRVTVSEVKDLKMANQVLDKVTEFKDVGLYYRYFKTNHRRLVCIHDASSASKGRNYAQEGILVGLADDYFHGQTMEAETVFEDEGAQGVQLHGGVFHVLHSSGGKAKRVSYSTSHAETLSMVNGMETTTLIMVRLAEIMHKNHGLTIKQLIKIQENGCAELPTDFYGDCRDVYELVTGARTLPQDKGQRLYILSIKESRIAGKMRMMVLVPTQSMTADSLTKPMIHHSMLYLLTTGMVQFDNEPGHPVTARVLPALENYDEHDIVKTDEQIIEMTKEENYKICHATMLLGLVTAGSTMTRAVLAASMLQAATAMDMEKEKETTENETYVGVYIMIFITVILAINIEKIITYVFGKISTPSSTPVKIEVKDEPSPMDVDESHLDMDVDSEEWNSRKRSRNKQRQDMQDLQEALDESSRQASSWETFSTQIEEDRDRYRRICEQRGERIEELTNKIEEITGEKEKAIWDLEKSRAKLNEKIEENNKQKDVVATSARTITSLREKIQGLENEKKTRDQKEKELFASLKEEIKVLKEEKEKRTRTDGDLFSSNLRISQLQADEARLKRHLQEEREDTARLQARLREAKAPAKIYVTRSGTCYHEAACNHLMHAGEARPRVEYQRCKDCL